MQPMGTRTEEDIKFQKSLFECQIEASLDGILVVSKDRQWLFWNQRFIVMWDIQKSVLESRSSQEAVQTVCEKLVDPKTFLDKINYLYEHPGEESHDEVQLKDGRTFDRYSAPVKSKDGFFYGRVWYYRDISGRKQAENAQKELIEKLQQSINEVRILSGLLPICSNCKKIRDSDKNWHPLEVYIRDRSEANFSHSICPVCYKELYSDLLK